MKMTKPMVAEIHEDWIDDRNSGIAEEFGISEERVHELFDWCERAGEEAFARGETEVNALRVFAKLLEAEVFSSQDLLLYAFKGFMYKTDMKRALHEVSEQSSLGGMLRRIAQHQAQVEAYIE